jgi:hypothetical protein
MKITVYYVVRVYKDGSARMDSGPHKDYEDACCARDEQWVPEYYNIMESVIEGKVL